MEFYDFIQINEQLRSIIYSAFTSNFSTCDLLIVEKTEICYDEMFNYITQINDTHPNLYQRLVCLAYVDNYLLLNYQAKNKTLSITLNRTWENYQNIHNIDELMNLIKLDPNSLRKMLISSLIIYEIEPDYLAELYTHADEEYLAIFNKFIYLEKDALFKKYSLEELILKAKRNMNQEYEETEAEYNGLEADLNYEVSVWDIFYHIKTLGLTNEKECYDMIITMLYNYYRNIKMNYNDEPEIITNEDLIMIKLIEEQPISVVFAEIINNEFLLTLLIEDYLSYNIMGSVYDEEELDSFYRDNIGEEIKRKFLRRKEDEDV